MLKQLHLVNFRSFQDFIVSFGEGAYLVGPNNAGKSTLLTALRVADVLIRFAYRRKSEFMAVDGDVRRHAYPVVLRDFPALEDSLRHEFGDAEARLELTWKSGARLIAVWPEETAREQPDAFFYLLTSAGLASKTTERARSEFPPLGIIPILGPVEHAEKLLADDYVKQNIAGRLSSRHFRNQLRLQQENDQLSGFFEWAEPWLSDISFDRLNNSHLASGTIVQAFIFETGSRVPKEIVWAGDGIQVWLQLLYHVYRVRDHQTVVLDEPEVYLHPDLQRRLVHLLESTHSQVVVATHSAEMVTESDGRLTVLIDRSRKRALRARTDADYELLTSALGTAFNLRLGRALRSRVAVFVEGQDMAVLRRFAHTLGLAALESEVGITVIPLKGYTHWGQVEPFRYLLEELLPDAIKTVVILDRDYRTDQTCREVEQSFEAASITAHIWERKELESYLVNSAVIARISGAPAPDVATWLSEIVDRFENEVFSRALDEKMRTEVGARNHAVNITSAFKGEFDAFWADPTRRLHSSPPKQILSEINRRLQSGGWSPVSIAGLARAHRVGEIPDEVVQLLRRIEDAAS